MMLPTFLLRRDTQRLLSAAAIAMVGAAAWGQEASEPGSFFRSSDPPAESSFSASDDTDDATAAPAEEASGMSRFGAPPPFSAAPGTGSAPAAMATPPADAPAATVDLSTPAAASPPPAAEPPPPSSMTAVPPPPVASAPPAADATRSVLTSPPEAPMGVPPSALAAPPAAMATPPNQFASPPTATLQEPAAFDAASASGVATPSAAADTAAEQVALPNGPATDLIEQALKPVEQGSGPAVMAGLAARPLPLLEALERSADRGRRLWITQAYWKLVEQAAVLRWTAEAADRLDLVAPGADPHDRATLDVAVASRLADVAAARAALVSAQQELVDLVRLPASEPLPWPVDQPLATSYETHFDLLFASRVATGRIRAINRSLPLEHEEVDARAAAVLAAETAVAMAENDHARGVRGIESVIAAHAALLDQQRALATAVTRYNDDIVEYVMAVADFSVPDEQFATMLIGTPTPWRPPVALTSAAVPVGGAPTLAAPPAGGGGQPTAAGTGFLQQ